MEFQNHLSVVDCSIECCQENKPKNGEDSYVRALNVVAGIVGVCDGCGGSGSKKYTRYLGRTGAYMASRAVSAAAKDWFYDFCDAKCADEHPAKSLKTKIIQYLSICRDEGGEDSVLKGFMSKDFPTTASIIVTWKKTEALDVLCLWAGDSRCYMLSDEGLFQLTEDDLDVKDAMENLTADGVLTNVITTSKDFVIHSKHIEVNKPCILFAASDGCFGYYSTPMEFEYVLLDTLQRSSNIVEWEQLLKHSLVEVAGDDLSLYGYAYLYGSFKKLKGCFVQREKHLFDQYIRIIKDAPLETKKQLWQSYRHDYSRYLYRATRKHAVDKPDDLSPVTSVCNGSTASETHDSIEPHENTTHGFRPPTELD